MRLTGDFQFTLEGPLQCEHYNPATYPFSCELQGPFYCTLDRRMLYKISKSPDNLPQCTLHVLRNDAYDIPQHLLQDGTFQPCNVELACTLSGTFQCTLYGPLRCKNHGLLTLLPYSVYRCYRTTAPLDVQPLRCNQKIALPYENSTTIEPRLLLFKLPSSCSSPTKKGQHFEGYFMKGVERMQTKGLCSTVEFKKELQSINETRSNCYPDAVFINGTNGAVVDMKNYTDTKVTITPVKKIIKDMDALKSYLSTEYQQPESTVPVIGCLYIRKETNISPNAVRMARENNVCIVREGIIDADELVNIVDTTVNNGTTCTCIRNNNVASTILPLSLSTFIAGYFDWMWKRLWQCYDHYYPQVDYQYRYM